MATYVGTVFNDTYFGNAGTQYGLDGNDHLSPSADNKQYRLYGGEGADTLNSFSYDDFVYGGGGNDTLIANNGYDTVVGDAGNDALYGDYGNDSLTGGPGRDLFIFDSTLNSNQNYDTIEDFHSGEDLVYLSKSIFAGVGGTNQSLSTGRFAVGSHPTTPGQRILYNSDSGVLYYTPDGSDSSQKIRFALVDKQLDLHASDFFIIA